MTAIKNVNPVLSFHFDNVFSWIKTYVMMYVIFTLFVGYITCQIAYEKLEHENKQLKALNCDNATYNVTLTNTRILSGEEIENKKLETLEKNMRMIKKDLCKYVLRKDEIHSPVPKVCSVWFPSEFVPYETRMRFEKRNPGYYIDFKESWIGSMYYITIVYKGVS